MNNSILPIAIAISILVTGCINSGQLFKRKDFTSYLDQFVGKSKQEVLTTIDLKQFGFEAVTQSKSLQSEQQIVYSIVRPLNIPIPMPAQASFGGATSPGLGGAVSGAGMVPSGASGGNSYEVKATCNIIFNLENNIVTKWDAKGKAC